VIKLDRTLVTDVSQHPTKAALIESFARYGQRTGAEICAEGVEALEDLRTLAELDVTYAQGFVIARPRAGWPRVSADAQATCAATDPALFADSGPGPESDERILERIVAELSSIRTRPALHGCLKRVAANLNADELHITMLDPTGTYLEAVSGLGSALEGTRWLLADYPDTERVLRAQETRQVMARDPHADPAEVELLRVQGIASMLMVPILYGGLTVGLLEAYATEERPWSRGQIYRARIIAYQLGAVLQRLGAATEVPAEIPARSAPLEEIVRRRRLAGPQSS
jgi:GAF domain-containing protein